MTTTETSFPRDSVTVLERADIDAQDWLPLRGLAGVGNKVLWRSGQLTVGIIRLEPGAEEPGHVHPDADHHIYVLDGSARIAGQDVRPGGFVFVPAGVRHATTDVGPDGCTFYYTYLPHS